MCQNKSFELYLKEIENWSIFKKRSDNQTALKNVAVATLQQLPIFHRIKSKVLLMPKTLHAGQWPSLKSSPIAPLTHPAFAALDFLLHAAICPSSGLLRLPFLLPGTLPSDSPSTSFRSVLKLPPQRGLPHTWYKKSKKWEQSTLPFFPFTCQLAHVFVYCLHLLTIM